jgi:TonB-linked SusC/RagA family outer membrane protein
MNRNAWVVAALLALAGAVPTAGQNGTIVGQVLNRSTGSPLPGAQVFVVGTSRGALANQEGRFLIQQVPPGQHEVRATLIGFATQTELIDVQPGQTAQTTFELSESAIELGAVVATATGQQQTKREIGSSVAVIQVDEVELAPVKTFSELIQGRAAGLSVTRSGGTTGGGSRVRIRGSNSMSLSNDPLVVLDGVRVDNNTDSYGLFTGGQTASRLNDLNPADIATIEFLKGPAASALYGTAAANGVIQITTRKGRVGDNRWRAWAEASTLDMPVTFPDNVTAVDSDGALCTLARRASGACTAVAQVYTFNPLENEDVTPFRTGSGERFGASVSGGSDLATYYLSVEREQETGVLRENDMERTNLRANLTGFVTEVLTVGARVGYVDSEIQFPQNDNSGLGILWNGLYAPPTPFYVDNFDGFALPPDHLFGWDQFQDLNRFTGSANVDWSPLDWLTVNGTAGLDQVNRHDNDLAAPNVMTLLGPPFSIGLRESWRFNIYNYTANGNGTARWSPIPDIQASTSVGVQYHRSLQHTVFASGSGLTPGTSSLAGASTDFAATETNVQNITLGAYAQQQLNWRDRLYLTAAVRGDRNSAFGTNLEWIWYPALSGSYVISEESWFPEQAVVDDLRLRAAWGQSGLRPTFRQALQFFAGVTAAAVDGEEPGFVISGAGNPDLKPEISTEVELGLEADLLSSRAGLELTWYRKESDDALVNVPLPPSFGSTGNRVENIGSVLNTGVEAALSVTPVQLADVQWEVRISGSTNKNEVLTLGDNEDIVFGLLGATQRHRVGHEPGAYFQVPIHSFEDTDGDGFLDAGELEMGILNEDGDLVTDSVAYMGTPFPTRELSIGTDLRLWDLFQVSGLLEFKGGHTLFNATKWGSCGVVASNCAELYEEDTPLERQAAILAWATNQSVAGFMEDADFWKLRELSLTFIVPQRWVAATGADGLRLTVAGVNLATWTDYSGFDPELNGAGQSNFNTFDLTTLPPTRSATVRLDVTF